MRSMSSRSSRREVLGAVTGAAVGPAVRPGDAPQRRRVGIIGLGGISRAHFGAIATLPDVRVVAVADLVEDKRREAMARWDVPRGYPSHTELLEDEEVQAVAVVLGHQLHHRLVVDACDAGQHVLVEKPMA